jgi:hypothetical protein
MPARIGPILTTITMTGAGHITKVTGIMKTMVTTTIGDIGSLIHRRPGPSGWAFVV